MSLLKCDGCSLGLLLIARTQRSAWWLLSSKCDNKRRLFALTTTEWSSYYHHKFWSLLLCCSWHVQIRSPSSLTAPRADRTSTFVVLAFTLSMIQRCLQLPESPTACIFFKASNMSNCRKKIAKVPNIFFSNGAFFITPTAASAHREKSHVYWLYS